MKKPCVFGGSGGMGRGENGGALSKILYFECLTFSAIVLNFLWIRLGLFGFPPGYRDWQIKGSKTQGKTKKQKSKEHPNKKLRRM